MRMRRSSVFIVRIIAVYSAACYNASQAKRQLSSGNGRVTTPGLFLGFILATLYGAFFHLIVGGDARRLALYLLAGWLGFSVGQVLGTALEITLFQIGPLKTGAATIGSLVALLAAHILGVRLQSPANP